jgi:hypothetical protein
MWPPNLSLDNIILLLVIGSFVFNVINSLVQAGGRAAKQREAQLRELERQLQAQEADPNSQSYQGYLQRTRPENLEREPAARSAMPPTVSPPTASPFEADLTQAQQSQQEQQRLRQEMARKLAGSPSRTPTVIPAPAAVPTVPPLPSRNAMPPRTTYMPPSKPVVAPTAAQMGERDPQAEARRQRERLEVARLDRQRANAGVSITTSLRFESNDDVPVVTPSGNRSKRIVLTTKPQDLVQAMIWSEVLGPPKSKRR